MSDKLDWMNKHLVLLQYPTVKEAVEKENYPASTDQLELAEHFPDSEDFLLELERQHEYKDACCFLAYNMHKRAAVWWAYLCVVDLLKELKKKPAKKRDIEDIGKPKPFNIPDWAKDKPVVPPADVKKNLAEFDEFVKKAWSDHDARMAKIDPEVRKIAEQGIEIFMNEFRKVHGKDLFELVAESGRKIIRDQGNEFVVNVENSPITKATDEVKAQIEKSRQETIKTVKAALPKVDIKAKKKMKLDALNSTYSYIVSPDEDNANNCLTIGNKGPDMPEGLLALCAFWSFGDLAPKGKIVVKTPAGLMANGINSLLLMLSLAEGGERKLPERYENYYKIGYDVAIGKSNWSKSVEDHIAPHDEVAEIKYYSETEKKVEKDLINRFKG
ncbi:MAG: hypothetical protein J5934_05565 [Succinivibrio sp.]|nr:hypothetical protein [Succinivibrio sp.]